MSKKKNYSKTVDRMTMATVLTLFVSVALLIADQFVDRPLSAVMLVAGLVGLIAFVAMVYKSGKMMEKEDAERALAAAEATPLDQPRFGANSSQYRDTLHRSTLEDDRQYGSR